MEAIQYVASLPRSDESNQRGITQNAQIVQALINKKRETTDQTIQRELNNQIRSFEVKRNQRGGGENIKLNSQRFDYYNTVSTDSTDITSLST